ncbi:MAG: 3-oxoacyl-[acyl-carrier protein] reductase [Solirubrobacterales bacterium]|jgi:NAD(P)-dependent dehydrogenase (short-subunit alcohol dehydrogenase family)|nr:3-oxoacyl-[acyl-carrier protein] reductase [Solirubrobacterales bacterium]
MSYFVTGGTGFIGRNLIEQLLEREGTIHVLVREGSRGRLEELRSRWGAEEDRIVPVVGDISQEMLGCDHAIADLKGEIDHFFHLAAIYDMTADAESQRVANVEGTRRAVALAEAVEANRFHMVSSIAAAGLYKGTFTEEMFDEAHDVENHPYFQTKHESEAVVRDEAEIPWRIYRPGIVVGHSETGEMDKIDGPYYFFKLIQRARNLLPPWVPAVGIEGREINIVPVDFVAKAMDHIAHQDGLDGMVFHLTDPKPLRAGQIINLFARAAHAPEATMRIDSKMLDIVPKQVRSGVQMLPPVKRITDQVLADLGIPRSVLVYINYPTSFDSTNTQRALQGTDISVPPLPTYADRLWDYWERNLDPDLFKDRSLAGAIGGKVVMITGASSGIGKAAAIKAAAAGATVLLVARTPEKLEETKNEIEEAGGEAHIHRADLSDVEDVERMAEEVLAEHGKVDILVNNAGRSIRRSIALSYDRFHDFERTMQLNYFGSLKLILSLLPAMRKAGKGKTKGGHIINVSSIGVQTNTPRFSAYVASKAALDAWSRCAASEMVDDKVHITTIHMPLVRTPMIAPTKMYDAFPTITPEEAADMICDAMIRKPKKVATRLGNFGETLYTVAPKASDAILNTAYKLFPESKAAKGEDQKKDGKPAAKDEELSTEGVAFAYLMRGVHW